MNRNFITGVVITSVLIVIFLFVFYFSKINTKSIHAINVLPQNTVLALEVNNFSLQYKLLNNQLFWQQLTNNKVLGEANNSIRYLDSILSFEENFNDWKSNENITISFHGYANKSIDALVLFETKKKFEMSDITNWIFQNNKNRLTISKRKFFGNVIYDFLDFKTQKKFSLAFKNKILAISENGQLIEETLINIDNKKAYETSKLDKLSFVKSLGNYNLYINHKNIPTFLSAFVDLSKLGVTANLPNFAAWSAFGVNVSNSSISLKGVTITDDVTFQYYDCFNNMQAQEFNFKKLLPSNTSYFFGVNFSNENLFAQNLKEYYTVNKINTKNITRDSINIIKQNYNLYNQLIENFGNEVLQVNLSNVQFSFDSCEVLAVKLKNKEKLLNQLKAIAINDSLNADTIISKLPNLYKINLLNYFDYTWGNIFLNKQANYALVYGEYVLFANNALVLSSFYNSQLKGNLLAKDANYLAHQSELSINSNIEFFINNNLFVPQMESIVNSELVDDYKSNMGYFKKTRFVSYQMNATNDKNYLTNVQIDFNTTSNSKTELLWELAIDTNLAIKPQIVFNSSTNQNCIFIQDLRNQVYLINNESKVLFKVPISGKIVGNVNQVDAFNNGNTQYLFNTNSQIYLIDETGKNVQGYPIWIPTGTNYPIQVSDYLNDKSYQIFAVGKYYKIWCYNIQGRLQSGWNPKNSYPNPIQNIKSFKFRNELISYVINEKGKLNFYQFNGKPYSYFGLDSNAVYKYMNHQVIDTGFIKFYYIDSTNNFKVKEYHTNGTKKDIILTNINFIPTDNFDLNSNFYFYENRNQKVNLFNSIGNRIYTKNLTDSSSPQLELIYKNGAVHVCYLDSLKGKVYLEKLNNSLLENFPVNANYFFTFGHLNNDENYFLITSDFDNKLFVYQVK